MPRTAVYFFAEANGVSPILDWLRELRRYDKAAFVVCRARFHGRDVAILAHGLTKESSIPEADLKRALERKQRYEKDPTNHRAQADPTNL